MNDDDPTLPFRRAFVRDPESMPPIVLEPRERPTFHIRLRPPQEPERPRAYYAYATVGMFVLAIGVLCATAVVYVDGRRPERRAPAQPPPAALSAIPVASAMCPAPPAAPPRGDTRPRTPTSRRAK